MRKALAFAAFIGFTCTAPAYAETLTNTFAESVNQKFLEAGPNWNYSTSPSGAGNDCEQNLEDAGGLIKNAVNTNLDHIQTQHNRINILDDRVDNVGALSAALGAVPSVSADSKLTCGFGAGTHSSAYAISGGCASKVSERASLNAAIATVINNGTGGSGDNISARAGFAFKLGKIDKSSATNKQLQTKVLKLENTVKALIARLDQIN